jgi:glycosyltransferase involved in cell wall biosynthesis
VSDGENGWLLAAGSLEDLVSALRTALLTSPQSMSEMGERGRQRVLEQHAISTEAKKLSELFSNLSEQLPESLKMETERYTAQ